jgi:hypothetical protein
VKGKQRAELQAHGQHRKGRIGLRHGENHGQRGSQVAIRGAALFHHGQRRHRRREADEVDLQRREDAQPGQPERPQQRADARHQPVQRAACFEQAHQREHDHHHRQQHEKRQFDRRAAGLENDVDQDVHESGLAG